MSSCHRPAMLIRRLAVAGWGAGWGFLLSSVAIAALIHFNGELRDTQHPALLPSAYLSSYVVIPWQERYERLWFILACAIGPLTGWMAIRFFRPSPWASILAVLLAIPALRWACASLFSGNPDPLRLLLAVVVLLIPFIFRITQPADAELADDRPAMSRTRQSRMWITSGALSLLLGLILIGLVGPYHIPTVASECNTELHVASYVVGPSLYYRAPGVVPGLDFESHYGIGHAYAFSFAVGSGGLQRTLERYVVYLLIITVLYFISAQLVLTDWVQNPWTAWVITAAMVFTSCQGLSYNGPSCWPIRHPFLFVFLFAAVRGIDSAGFWWCVLAALMTGLSVFWQTDVGLYTLAAGAAFYASSWLFLRSSVSRVIVFLSVSIGSFFAINTALFGHRVLSMLFVERLFEPLLLYATGFGNQLLNWEPGWSYWYNLLGPGLAIASIGVMLGLGQLQDARSCRAVMYSSAASLLGLALLFKWVNRSIDILWDLNGGLIIAVGGWWCWIAWQALAQLICRNVSPTTSYLRKVVIMAGLALVTTLAIQYDYRTADSNYQGGSSSPVVRTCLWFKNFKSPINAYLNQLSPNVQLSPIDPEVTKYLRSHTRRTDRVAVICGADWNYLLDAGRAPRLSWLQLFLIHSPKLLDRCVKDLEQCERVFVDRYAWSDLKGVNPETYKRVKAVIDEQFELTDNSSKRWDLYSRKQQAPTRPQ